MPAVETILIEEAKAEAAEAALAADDGADESIDAVRDFHRTTARKIWPRGSVLRCPRCGRTRTATVGELTTFLGHGWPACHGETMHLGGASG